MKDWLELPFSISDLISAAVENLQGGDLYELFKTIGETLMKIVGLDFDSVMGLVIEALADAFGPVVYAVISIVGAQAASDGTLARVHVTNAPNR